MPTTGGSSAGTGGETHAAETTAAATTAGATCEPGDVAPCLCADGLRLGEQHCDADGTGFLACLCEGATDEDGSTGDPMPPLPAEVCYLGGDRAGTTCLPLVAFYADLPEGYAYPPGERDDGQDRPPLGLVDIEGVDPALLLAPNFALEELAQLEVGRFAVLQPHAVASLQAMRDAAGSIGVITGYLSPAANMAAGGELHARHQYGDGFDLEPHEVSPSVLSDLCVQEGGIAVELGTSVRCELSAVPVDEAFFGPPP
jgi:Peptidase M15